jgi:hypothetical protein
MHLDLFVTLATCATFGVLAAVTGRPPNWSHPRRCTATKSTTGERCTHYALRGSTVCKYHGGAAPQVQRAISARRMKDLYDPMLAGLTHLLASGDLDAIAKACALISRHYLADIESGRLPAESGSAELDWIQFLEDDELQEITDLMASYEALARERMDSPGEQRAPLALSGDVIDVTPSGANGNGR